MMSVVGSSSGPVSTEEQYSLIDPVEVEFAAAVAGAA